MRLLFRLSLAGALFLPAGWVGAQDLSREQRWGADLQALVDRIQTVHPNPYTRTGPAEFAAEVEALRQRIPAMTDAEVVVGLSRILALLNDAHSALNLGQAGTGVRRYPIGFRWFSDGLFITTAPETLVRLVGTRVRAMNGQPVHAVYEALRPWISHDSESWYRYQSQAALTVSDLLRVAGIVGPDLALALEVESPSGEVFTEEVPLTAGTMVEGPLQARPNLPLYRRFPALDYWFEYLPETRTLYVQYNRCRSNALLPMGAFADELVAFLGEHRAARWVIDVRENSGGSSIWFQQLLEKLRAAITDGKIAPPEAAFGIIGKRTFSSGTLAVREMQSAGVTLVGETTGGRVSWFGENLPYSLPNSRLTVAVSTRIIGDPATGPVVEPNFPVDFPSRSYFANRDPYLEAVLDGTVKPAASKTPLALAGAANQ